MNLGYYVHGLVRTLGYNVLSVEHEKRVMNDIQNGEASSVSDRSHKHVEPVFPVRCEQNRVLDRTFFGYYVPFFISLEGTNNRVSLYTGPMVNQKL